MLPTPSSTPMRCRPALKNQTNVHLISTPSAKRQAKLEFSLPTPDAQADVYARRKRVKISPPEKLQPLLCEGDTSDSDTEMEGIEMQRFRARACRSSGHFNASRLLPLGRTPPRPDTRHILRSFVSSTKADVFKCEARETGYALTVPYACAYSNGAKQGRDALLAVATEAGSLHILNTARRNDWDSEPQRTTLQVHSNGIFDVRWNPSDSFIATASADQTASIICPRTSSIIHTLQGHASTIKCLAWDPKHRELLTTGGRDGAICLWDLRVAEGQREGILSPVHTIKRAQEDASKPKPRGRRPKASLTATSITGVLYQEADPYEIVSSGSADGKLKGWDLRQCFTEEPSAPQEVRISSTDPTTSHGSSRSRGITDIAAGTGSTTGLVFAVGFDSRVHTYDSPTLTPQMASYTKDTMSTGSFYVRTAISPCGRWLASGSSGKGGNAYLFDVSNAARPRASYGYTPVGVELAGQQGEVGAVDWASDMVATLSFVISLCSVMDEIIVMRLKALHDVRDQESNYVQMVHR